MRIGCGPRFTLRDIPPGLLAMGFGPRGWGGGGGWEGDWSAEFGHRRGGRGKRRMFESCELRLVLLKLIADQPRHGYDLIRAIEELTHGSYAPSPGVVYPTLTMLQDMGLIQETEAEGSRKIFAVTPEGETHLEERKEEIDGLMARLEEMGDDKRKAGGAP